MPPIEPFPGIPGHDSQREVPSAHRSCPNLPVQLVLAAITPPLLPPALSLSHTCNYSFHMPPSLKFPLGGGSPSAP